MFPGTRNMLYKVGTVFSHFTYKGNAAQKVTYPIQIHHNESDIYNYNTLIKITMIITERRSVDEGQAGGEGKGRY